MAPARTWVRGLATGGALLCVLFALAPEPQAEEKVEPEKPSYGTDKCGTCHEKLLTKANVHSAIDFGECSDCHWPNSEGASNCGGKVDKSWKLAKDEPALCKDCHEFTGNTAMHTVIDLMGCTACHDAHSADHANNLNEDPTELCVGCHEGPQSTKNVHMPVEFGECIECHSPHIGVEAPLLKKPKSQLCHQCHEPETLIGERVDHAPVKEGMCTGCHSPHGSDNEYNLLKGGNELCLQCHDSKSPRGLKQPRGAKRINMGKDVIHGAIDLGECRDCHFTHTSKHNKLLKERPPKLCYECHDRKDDKAFTHSAVAVGDCAVCHDPHTANNQKLLRSTSTKRLCFRCHEDDLTGRRFIHRPAKQGKCDACHSPHGADNPFNLKLGEGKNVCYSCHDQKDKGKYKHLALERYGCTACHDPHGTANQFMLARSTNRLCQTCHTKITDGLHVTTFVQGGHKIEGGPDPHNPERDFSCASCHEPHGSDSPKILRYGKNKTEICDWCHGDRTGENPELKDISRVQRPSKKQGKQKSEPKKPPVEKPPKQKPNKPDDKGKSDDDKGKSDDDKGKSDDDKGGGTSEKPAADDDKTSEKPSANKTKKDS